jgi:carbonic anhydrase
VSDIGELVAANERYAASYTGGLGVRPTRRLAVVTCMDSRMDVHAMLGLRLGEAHAIRNAGGVVTDDVIRSLAISQRSLGTTAIAVIHHTECGLLGLDEDAFVDAMVTEAGAPPRWRPGSFADPDQDVQLSVATLRSSPFLPHRDDIHGFVFEVDSGRLRSVS